MANQFSRRQFVQGIAVTGLAVSSGAWATSAMPEIGRMPMPHLKGKRFDLSIDKKLVNYTGKSKIATVINGSLPAPVLRFKEGETVTINVTNHLKEWSSIHWHGLLLPYEMDGVPGISFEGIAPGETFTYQFPILQSGTYWYHSHSGFQEQKGMMGAIIIEPREGEIVKADCDHVVMLSDWTDENPMVLLNKLKSESDFDNYQQPTAVRFIADMRKSGWKSAVESRKMWNEMRMSPTDFTDLSAGTYTYLMNGTNPASNWTGLFNKGDRVRLRFINGSAQTIFDVRIPGLKLTVIGTDGQLVEPVTVDEFRIGVAETYDVLVEPSDDAYTIFAQNIDRSGFARGTLAIRDGLSAPVPALDKAQWLSMSDMMGDMSGKTTVKHASTEYGFSTDMHVDSPRTNLDDPGVNLRNNGRRVLTYADLRSIGEANNELSEPTRELELHLTGNMERYIWGFDGLTFQESTPVYIAKGERVRITLVNDTMMTHPMHLHGMWSDLRDANGDFQVRKHTIMVQPAQKISFDVTGEEGRWAWHCHLLYHMESGMFREVVVD
ncbi:CopA family copper-resistance protein [Paraperlucidibaca baekdonensis]|uniref:CopA family copper-resistance protein n=1 Tax=Paraperlucidibaca baekdonensis TaxID=748120 RepID=A0A3E0H7B8_9GAMM|nr:copper resistance system multicopper oxidase [Paraperlucidibaca baekdonensis]REH39147.1 CopA family copper-resistance protein [Paraperlucidibaca baekdonensis]